MNMNLPPYTDVMISRVLEARPDAVVVIQCGTPVAMPWAGQARAIVQMPYGGNEGGHGLVDVIFGDANPVSTVIAHRTQICN